MILNKSQKQELLTKHAKFFAADKKESRDTFKGIRYQADGTAVVSDTHVLLRIKDVSPFTEPCTLHAITGAEIEGTYPNEQSVDNLLTWNQENQMTLGTHQIEACTKYAKIAQMIKKELKSYDKLVNLVLCKANASLQVLDQGVELNTIIGELVQDQDEEWSVNADYLYNAFNLFKSAKSNYVVIKFRHKNDVIVFSDEENGIDVLILPVRTNAEVRDGCS